MITLGPRTDGLSAAASLALRSSCGSGMRTPFFESLSGMKPQLERANRMRTRPAPTRPDERRQERSRTS